MIKRFVIALLPLLHFAPETMAQDEKSSEKKMESQQIIIQQKGDRSGSISVQIDGDQVTVNGKPLSEYKDDNVTIRKKNIIISDGDKIIFDDSRSDKKKLYIQGSKNAGGKALLGVNTETAEKGVRIMSVSKGSAAEKAGLQRGDVIRKINSEKIGSPDELSDLISKMKPGDEIKIRYEREGKEKTIKAELGEFPTAENINQLRSFSFSGPDGNMRSFVIPPMGDDFNLDNFQMPDLSDLGIDIRASKKPKLGLKIQDTENNKGVKVLDVEDNSAASTAGILKGDIITGINGKNINNTDEAREELKENAEKTIYSMDTMRDGKKMRVDINMPRKLKTAEL